MATVPVLKPREVVALLTRLGFAEVRQRGMILAIEMVKDKKMREPFAWQERRGLHVSRHALEKGVLLRPLGNVVYFMPPYVITEEQIQHIADVAWQGIQLATADI